MVRTHRRRLSLCQLLDGTGNYAFAGQFTTFDLPAYAEQALVGASTFALAYGAKSVTASRSELGLRSDKSFAMPDGIFTLRGRAAWAHDFNTERIFGATFQTLPGASFVVGGAAQVSDSALVTEEMAERLVCRRYLRGRVLQCDAQLRWQGRGEIFLVALTLVLFAIGFRLGLTRLVT